MKTKYGNTAEDAEDYEKDMTSLKTQVKTLKKEKEFSLNVVGIEKSKNEQKENDWKKQNKEMFRMKKNLDTKSKIGMSPARLKKQIDIMESFFTCKRRKIA